MTTLSTYVIPCVCGRELHAHTKETTCPACGRLIVLEWGREPVVVSGNPSEEERRV